MKVLFCLTVLAISSSAFANWNANSTECKGRLLTTSRSWQTGMSEDESSSSIAKTHLKEGRDFSVDYSPSKITGKKDDIQKCLDESGADTGAVTGSSQVFSTVTATIKFSKSSRVPAKMRGKTVIDALSCVDEDQSANMQVCP